MADFYEFFAGGGMARAGLGPGWRCLLANDFDPRKAASYRENWGEGGEFRLGDVAALTPQEAPGRADLAWASFPCQDLSVAGAGGGLKGARSGSFHPFWRLIEALGAEGRGPRIVALENVLGTLGSHGGADFAALCGALAQGGYRFGALAMDAALFLPQSRPRLFLIGAREEIHIPEALLGAGPQAPFHTPALRRAAAALPLQTRRKLLWWRPPPPPTRSLVLADLIEEAPGLPWDSPEETGKLLAMMAEPHRAKVAAAQAEGLRRVGTLYKRTRRDPGTGGKIQRAEIRFDGLAGCLRTPAGGSSRQTILVVEGESLRSRLLSPRETARLMGLDDAYRLPPTQGAAYHLTGDGVAAPVVRHLARHLFEPLLAAAQASEPARTCKAS
ncbi:DNA cytosine methyltransferase [Neomegalonema sp.]|uniref:DNA cytosine methyltransferase n=1 Tax=Neomegalonema sp. TaxID=2039713 RepID=UPI002637E9F2|nr:DNA (cytosine-5-)-methyltransferase [Neomegalonema sp.]MDD2868623.1 DNA (cytosine-5-)-methyltransferase [Neomegalonema sp.]